MVETGQGEARLKALPVRVRDGRGLVSLDAHRLAHQPNRCTPERGKGPRVAPPEDVDEGDGPPLVADQRQQSDDQVCSKPCPMPSGPACGLGGQGDRHPAEQREQERAFLIGNDRPGQEWTKEPHGHKEPSGRRSAHDARHPRSRCHRQCADNGHPDPHGFDAAPHLGDRPDHALGRGQPVLHKEVMPAAPSLVGVHAVVFRVRRDQGPSNRHVDREDRKGESEVDGTHCRGDVSGSVRRVPASVVPALPTVRTRRRLGHHPG